MPADDGLKVKSNQYITSTPSIKAMPNKDWQRLFMVVKEQEKNIFRFLESTYNETVSLLSFAHDYYYRYGASDKVRLSKSQTVLYTLAMSTITTQLASSLGWLLTCKAVQAGEITFKEAKNEEFSLQLIEMEVDPNDSAYSFLPESIKEMLTRSNTLYQRVRRIEESISQN